MNLTIPAVLRHNIRFLLGSEDAGDAWLSEASTLAGKLAGSWGVTPVGVLEGGAMSLCVECRDGAGAPRVLKVPSSPERGRAETAALSAWTSGATPQVFRDDTATGSFLMEFVLPAAPVTGAQPITRLLARLHIDHGGLPFPDLEVALQDRIEGALTRFSGSCHTAERRDVEAAVPLLSALARTTEAPTVVHGDFQAKNVLCGPDGPVAIDPLPAVGDPVSDAALWIAGGSAGPRTDALEAFVSAGADPGRLLAWTWALTALEYRPGTATADDAADFVSTHRQAATAALSIPA
jgi:hypothetical protein